MVLGGALSLSDRRLRVGAPKPASARKLRCSRRSERDAPRRSWLSLLFAVALAAASPSSRCSPTKSCRIPALEARARDAVARIALHGVPEPVDRRFRCAAGARPAASGARAAQGRRQRTQVLDFLAARYGDFVLLKPRFGWDTALLWLAPAGVLLAVAARCVAICRRGGARPARHPSSNPAHRRRAGPAWRSCLTMADDQRGPSSLSYLNRLAYFRFPRLPKFNLAARSL